MTLIVGQYPMTKLDAAFAAARLGLPVFPIRHGGKAPPLVTNWPQIATTDENTLRQWWGEDGVFGEANVAIHCAGLLVVDVDVKNGGNDALALLDMTTDGLPATRTTVTPSGGRHLFYRLPEGHPGVPNSVQQLGKGLDIRSTNGYVVAPGSTTDAGTYAWASLDDIQAAPEWLVQRCGTYAGRERAEKLNIMDVPDAPDDVVERAAAWLRTAERSVKGSGGDQTAYRVAAGLRDRGLSYWQACELMRSEAWDFGCGWREGRLEEKPIRSAYRYAQNKEAGSLAVSADDFPTVTQVVPDTPAAPTKGRLTTLSEFASVNGIAPYLVKGILSTRSYCVMFGPPGEGKTFTALDLAYHVAAGKEWMGRRVRRGTVLYLAFEGAGGLRRRAQALMQHYADKDVPLYFDSTHYNLREQEGRQQLGQALAELPEKPVLIVIDTFAHALCGGDENSAQDVGAFNTAVEMLVRNTSACVMVLHHPPKNGNGPRGSGALHGAVDTELEVNNRRIEPTKQRDMEICPPIGFQLHPIAIGIDEDNEEISSCVVMPYDVSQLLEPPESKKTRADLAFDVMCRMTPNGEPILSDAWRDACVELLPASKASQRVAWFRLRNELETRGKIISVGEGIFKRRLE
jgi:hypothetical protein